MTRMNATDVEIVLSLGSNCGNRHSNVKAGIDWICKILSNFRVSPIYSTPDCLGGQKEYLNAVVIGNSTLTSEEIERRCKEYEILCGRNEETRKSNLVPIDIDIVVYDHKILRPRDFSQDFFQIGFKTITNRIENLEFRI